jgi:four helix bundle protein
MNSFEELECWKKSAELRKDISALVKSFPTFEKYALSSQMIRCSRSVTNNIAEGFGRFHFQENAQFCRQSRGSLFELIDHLSIALEEEYIDEEKHLELKSSCLNCIKILNGYIKYLLDAKHNNK